MNHHGGDLPRERTYDAASPQPIKLVSSLPDPHDVALGALLRTEDAPGTLWKTARARQIVRDDGDEYWDVVTVWVEADVVTPAELERAHAVHRRWTIWTWVLSILFVVAVVLSLASTAIPDWAALPPATLAIIAGIATQRAASRALKATLDPTS